MAKGKGKNIRITGGSGNTLNARKVQPPAAPGGKTALPMGAGGKKNKKF